ncbi:hypothetical protein acsn021_08600 [Anaerocolumna cellulosilytica]|uniref:Uncharacterized protein n=1 Tax=Anaerocolumna cellulosilytica TaxID=433286 RepID=A0A6S6R273_9FIRM|nr:hypothetical protein [Anaerocolumna cellulosilytica]MBB5194347.1 hypothetical protein [Anaerocolumna cellulosilytica]BCJ93291.1 hypothetical protein acsn021_08600 [Anaerocolumna cellulosilytica]
MSKINNIRIVNLNYNNNSIRIEDETFQLGGDSTLFSLRNGGGKSVLVQILTAPFVHKRYRDTKDRPFASYFTTGRPTFILVEWGLDGGAGYVLTGMMVRRRQDSEEEHPEELEVMQFIHEYKEANLYDLKNFPLTEEVEEAGEITGKKLLGFHQTKQVFETLKKGRVYQFDYYDMASPSQSRQYFERLREFRIYYKEWETIIKKVNLKESGLSELFMEAKDEGGLTEKWFLDAAQNKLNQEDNKIKEFGRIVYKYIRQYKENKTKILQKENIIIFKEDTQKILSQTDEYLQILTEKKALAGKIGGLIKGLKSLKDSNQQDLSRFEARLKVLEETLQQIAWEELSYQIYQLEDEKKNWESKRETYHQKLVKLQSDKSVLLKQKHILETARLNREFTELLREVKEYESALELAKLKNQDLEPERNNLGYNLRCHYEEQELSKKNCLEELQQLIMRKEEFIALEKEKIEERERRHQESIIKQGNLKARIDSYTDIEKNFNSRYGENLSRNILGNYEEIYLKDLAYSYQRLYRKKNQEAIHLKREREEQEETIYSLGRNLEDLQKELGSQGALLDTLNKEYKEYEAAINLRKEIIKYIHFPEEKLFQTEDIVNSFIDKITQRKEAVRTFERELDRLKEEYKKLESGQILELPKELEDTLSTMEIHYVLGMEWLKKNCRTTEENQKLVSRNPFIPYSIIMSESELIKLKKHELGVYTSFPIPIIYREDLEKVIEEKKSQVITGEQVNFLLLFNQKLLEEEELKKLLLQKQEEIKKTEEILKVRYEECRFYEEKKNAIEYQKLSEKAYKSCCHKVSSAEERTREVEEELLRTRQEKERREARQKKILEELGTLGLDLKEINEKEISFQTLQEKYTLYQEQRKQNEILTQHIADIANDIAVSKNKTDEWNSQNKESTKESFGIANDLKFIQSRILLYGDYRTGEKRNESVEELEIRYEAITKKLSQEQQTLEQQLDKARSKHKEREEELKYKENYYKLNPSDYKGVTYDRRQEEAIEKEMAEIEVKEKEITGLSTEIFAKVAVCESKISDKKKELHKRLQKPDLIQREKIANTNFSSRIKEQSVGKDMVVKEIAFFQKKIDLYDDNLLSLSEFYDLDGTVTEFYEQKDCLKLMDFSKEDLIRFRGNLLRDYRQAETKRNEAKQELSEILHQIMSKEAFSEEFFKRPLETMYQLIGDPAALKEQLLLTLSVYESLQIKLEIDISLVDKEKDKVMELLLEYTEAVHKNLGKIDKNSAIKIRDKSVKMLRIKLPDWEENLISYRSRMKDFVESLTGRGLELLEKNENIEEMIGSQLTTKNLYDTVVGIRNVEIKLYKIEELREYQISWAEVAKNSGGEGFLSAFVILSSLLSFMRREDTDIFSEYEEGKVLIMDNPFAQTNAAHLLKPLMDIAKKSNTQLICLSGLGGDSIYNRFDNIYVLNLITSNYKRGMQYLKAEHAKGEKEQQRMISTYIKSEDMEQIELLF